MFDVGQAVLVITDKGVTFEGYIKARAMGDNSGSVAYQIVAAHGSAQQGQWYRSTDVFMPEATLSEDPNSIETYLKK